MQCQAEKHGHRSVSTGREGNRSSRIGAPTAPRSAACSRRHSLVRPDSGRRSSPQRCSGGRRSRKYTELLAGDKCRLVVVALETGGRWSNEAIQFIDGLAAARSREAPSVMRRSAFLSWKKRWSRMIGISCGRAFADSLAAVANAPHTLAGVDGEMPHLADLLGEVRGTTHTRALGFVHD